MRLYEDHLAQAVLSADSPRFFAFIPAAPTKAALLFDMVVSRGVVAGDLLARGRGCGRGGEPGAALAR